MPKVSVLMPIYNTEEEYLREAIESILKQSFRDFEFLILNDSPWKQELDKIVLSYKDDRIKYLKNEANLGITPSRNKLIDMAKGEYLAITDHDDISLPYRIEKEVNYLDTHPNVGVVSSYIEIFGHEIRRKVLKVPENSNDIKCSASANDFFLPHPASMIRKSVITANNIYYEQEFSPSEDYRLFARLIPYTDFYNIQEVLLYYRFHQNNCTKTHTEKMVALSQKVQFYIRTTHPQFYDEYMRRAIQKTHIRLFGFIPFIKIVRHNHHYAKIYLFEKIPLFSLKFSYFL